MRARTHTYAGAGRGGLCVFIIAAAAGCRSLGAAALITGGQDSVSY